MVELTQEQLQMLLDFQQKQQDDARWNAFQEECAAIDDERYNVRIAPSYAQLKADRLAAEARGADYEELLALTAAHDALIAPIHAEYEEKLRLCKIRHGYL
jgi:hypothetical protein